MGYAAFKISKEPNWDILSWRSRQSVVKQLENGEITRRDREHALSIRLIGRRILPLPGGSGGNTLLGESKFSSPLCSTSVTSGGQARPVRSSTVSRTAVKSGGTGELASPYSNHQHQYPLPPKLLQPQQQHCNNNIKQDGHESDTVRNVRMLLAKHQSVPDLSQQPMEQGDTTEDSGRIIQESSLTSSETQSDPYLSSSALPGDSFPATGQQLMAASLEQEIDDLDEDSEQELLRHLSQSQARMEQIKRMLVNQRGFIVQALKQLAESTTTSERRSNGDSCHNCSTDPEEMDPAERDRTIGSSMKYAAATKSLPKSQINEEPEKLHEHVGGKLCPMCEAAFPDDIDEEIFESHVVEHFCYEDADTLKYVPIDELSP
ncbi:uncharacterized protein LOC131883769 isoform X2 [Tigriopus californicus]|uniref:uncharacterized protein LOC131883769 isoform X2 n=1 Tax=Tigriopus californicus TaxID=6832 RepID=UPI0027D9CF36|nr:uncharacterized protein LOC131883769 isoform X2 [Tigriopus californicus]